ncbi:nuclear mitotic apparatus protein 1-like isoform X8 [Ctenopharyngodon idella]|uniref:nuclear mitotic apparatus protein 1-like isoform X8 n=1 Tax=Ctenopharyngodon idella TaxID=7959 RepID=UPI0022323CA2|nr:nuclear mitotic apparatus protein 1-like isoform X8 [Ctenopharyngodon idella]
MELNGVKEAALLSWINSVCPEEPINKITQMMDGHRLLKLAYRVQGKESHDGLFLSPSPNMMEMFFSILQDDFQFSPRQASLMLWKISQGIELELQIAKVVLVLCYCGFTKYNMIPLDVKTGLMIASMFRFVEDDADGLSLDDDLNKFLTKASDVTFSTSSSGSSCWSPLYTDDKSPFIKSFEKPTRVQFQELVTVSCSLVSSPVQDVMSTPQLLKRLRKELAHGRDMKDALEKELANQINIISEKEGLIIQLQHRVDRMLREQQELEKDHKAALLELQEKNESLLHRVHEVLKQCQDLKTENRQKEKKMHELIEENQTFSAQVDFAEKRLQEWRKTIDDSEDVRCRESLSKLASCISRTATVKSRHANRLSNSQPKQKQSVMFVIANTPKRSGGGSLLRRGLKLREDACKTPTVASRGLRPAVSAANGRSPQVSALRKCRRNKSSKTFNAKQVKSRIISGQTLDLFLSIIFLFVCLLYTL